MRNKERHNGAIAITDTKNRRKKTATEEPPAGELKVFKHGRNLTLNSDAAQNYKYMIGFHRVLYFISVTLQ